MVKGILFKTTEECVLSIPGLKSTTPVLNNLPVGYSMIGYNKNTPQDAKDAFQSIIDSGKLVFVRWINPTTGETKELLYAAFPSPAWNNEIGNLIEGQGYIIKLNDTFDGFVFP